MSGSPGTRSQRSRRRPRLAVAAQRGDFDKLDGKMQAKMALRSAGNSQRAVMSNLGGTVFAVFQDGAIRGLNVAQMIRSLTSGTLSGWQEGKEQTTDLTQLSASFRVEKGQASTTDLNLVGPLVKMTGAGTIDLAAKAVAFRSSRKLVLTTEGQGRAGDPVGLGIPVVIDGPGPSRASILTWPASWTIPMQPMPSSRRWAKACSRQRRTRWRIERIGRRRIERQWLERWRIRKQWTCRQARRDLGNLLQQGLSQRRNQSRAIAPPPSPTPDAHGCAGAERSGGAAARGQPGDETRF